MGNSANAVEKELSQTGTEHFHDRFWFATTTKVVRMPLGIELARTSCMQMGCLRQYLLLASRLLRTRKLVLLLVRRDPCWIVHHVLLALTGKHVKKSPTFKTTPLAIPIACQNTARMRPGRGEPSTVWDSKVPVAVTAVTVGNGNSRSESESDSG